MKLHRKARKTQRLQSDLCTTHVNDISLKLALREATEIYNNTSILKLVLSWYIKYITEADTFKGPVLEFVLQPTFQLMDGVIASSNLFLLSFSTCCIDALLLALMGIIISIIAQADINHFSLPTACCYPLQ